MKLLASSFDKIPGEVEDPNVKAMLDRLELATEEEEKLTLRVEEGGTVGELVKQMWENDKIKGQGVYTWENGTRARVTTKANQLLFDLPLIFPQDDFRREYAGAFL